MESEGQLTIEVIDTGIGIMKDNMCKLFKPFASADGWHHKVFGGTGLGLWISGEIIKLMGGSIIVNSEGFEKGSTFTIKIPITYYVDPKKHENYNPHKATSSTSRIRKLTDHTQNLRGVLIIIVSENP